MLNIFVFICIWLLSCFVSYAQITVLDEETAYTITQIKYCETEAITTFEELKAEKLAKSIFTHFDGIVNYARTNSMYGLLEGINSYWRSSRIQIIKKVARGCRYKQNFARMNCLYLKDLQLKSFRRTCFYYLKC